MARAHRAPEYEAAAKVLRDQARDATKRAAKRAEILEGIADMLEEAAEMRRKLDEIRTDRP